MIKFADFSKWNEIDFDKYDSDYVILRLGFGNSEKQKDPKFDEYYKKAKDKGIKVGCYWFSYATTVSDAKKELQAFLKCAKGYKFELPVFYDIETVEALKTGKENLQKIAKTFIEGVEKAGGFCGLYCSTSPFLTYFYEFNNRYCLWLADYRADKVYSNATKGVNVAFRQYTSKGVTKYSKSYVDLNICCNDTYLNINKKYNNFK